jgi:iron(III) transport system ATP-binding protein
VRIVGVRADYGTGPVLNQIDLEVANGETVALLGPSGCGKTTLLRTIAGFIRPSEGTIEVGQRLVCSNDTWLAPERRNVGLVPQEGALFPHLSVEANIAFGLKGSSRSAKTARVEECLELVGLTGFGRRRPGELSGGQQQRVALARALAPEPAVVMLDEPFSALDATLRAQVREEVRDALREAGATAILVTHDQEEALSFADRVAVVQDGRLAQVADPETLYRHPVDLAVGAFVGDSVQLNGTTKGNWVHTELGAIPLLAEPRRTEIPAPDGQGARGTSEAPACDGHTDGNAVTVLLRPEQVELVRVDAGATPGEVLSVTYFGHDALIRLRLEDSNTEVLARIHRESIPAVGTRHGLRVSGAVAAFSMRPDHPSGG